MLRARLARRGMRTTERPVRRRANLVALLALVCVVAGCTYNRAEPSLFDHSRTSQTTVPLLRPVTPVESAQVANPDLPVVGEAIWTSADGLDITVRIAVHAVRRVAGGTVLDWSVTPLHGPGLQPNDPVPRTLDLGLTRPGKGYPNILLVDIARSRVYRPLTPKTAASGCLCTPVTVVQQNLRIDYTTLLQAAFPPLPDDLAAIDVQLATVPPFWQVPVTPAGMLPLASYETELTRPAEETPVRASTQPFTYHPARQHYLVMINNVYASSSFTSIAWTIQSLEAGRGLQSASNPPFADSVPPARAYNQISAGGPQIRLGNRLSRARLITTKLAGHGALECLCSDLRIGAVAMRRVGKQMSVVTNLPPVPPGTSKVDIVLPGLTTLRNVAVTAAPDAAFRSAGPAVREPQFWTYSGNRSQSGWEPRNWPTPVPRQKELLGYRATVDTIVR
jgi:hypothetical protein